LRIGTHPYFRIPLGGPRAADCLVKLPVSARWELAGLLPTGRRKAADDSRDYHRGKRFEELTLDDVFSGLQFEGKWCTAALEDPTSQTAMKMQFDRSFRECVVYTPPHREAICIEPYTCVPNAAALAERGIDGGLRVLAPGESFQAEVVVQVN